MTNEERIKLLHTLTEARVAYCKAIESAGYKVGVRKNDGSQAIIDPTKSFFGTERIVGYITLTHEIKI